ncbi:MAG TPA: peptide chain release factor N(5)-glutamine methyltransferase [Ferruginibacter sp.]|nr:peptide chain release factor N(5)-glutamine methyltransferase [Ferruginibacter sp.]HMP20226.1 peptide chain release factor N(5)-glutamine methyltransferase [Ferruginibacter sp.]
MMLHSQYHNFLQQLGQVYPAGEAKAITALVFEKIFQLRPAAILNAPETEINDTQEALLNKYLSELLQHRPVQYVLGEAWFYHLPLYVNESVLIPRPETEELVHWVLQDTPKQLPLSILDIGTGSGCMAIALKKNLPLAGITAIDISSAALDIAQKNATMHHAVIDFLQIDFTDENNWQELPAVDIIVTNPPYIPAAEINTMDRHVKAYEPHTALFVPDGKPLLFYEKTAGFAAKHLKPGSCIYAETHYQLAQEAAALFKKICSTVVVKKDTSGNERMIKAVV